MYLKEKNTNLKGTLPPTKGNKKRKKLTKTKVTRDINKWKKRKRRDFGDNDYSR